MALAVLRPRRRSDSSMTSSCSSVEVWMNSMIAASWWCSAPWPPQVLANATNRIAEGEVLQLLHVRNPDVDEAAYLEVIERKTAVLFAAGTRLGALASGADEATQQRLHDYGLQLGYAFQIADDMLDYTADGADLGKNLGDDLAEGKAILPL